MTSRQFGTIQLFKANLGYSRHYLTQTKAKMKPTPLTPDKQDTRKENMFNFSVCTLEVTKHKSDFFSYFTFYLYQMCVPVCTGVHLGMCKPEDNLWELVLSFPVGPETELPPSDLEASASTSCHLASPKVNFFKRKNGLGAASQRQWFWAAQLQS